MLIPTQVRWNPREPSGTGSLEVEQGYTVQLAKFDHVMQLAKFDHVGRAQLARPSPKQGAPVPPALPRPAGPGPAGQAQPQARSACLAGPAPAGRAGPGPANPAQAGASGHPLGIYLGRFFLANSPLSTRQLLGDLLGPPKGRSGTPRATQKGCCHINLKTLPRML